MASSPEFEVDDAPMQTEFPLTAVLGDGMRTRTINALIKTGGRHTVTVRELIDKVNASTEAEQVEVLEALNGFIAVGAVEKTHHSTVRYCPGHEAFQHLEKAERKICAKMHPESWFAEVVRD